MSRVVGPHADLPPTFAPLLIDWQRRAGRSGLPWQGIRDPYRVWLSEVMLQQTQVSTVLGYYARFLDRFPDVRALAAAEADEVMALWSGLGYYSRARNLHRCAQTVVSSRGGEFPSTAAGLETLPGIGASTAAAIASFCFGERVSIVDGNVRRVLTRVLAFEGDLAQTAPQRALWDIAQALLPIDPSADDMTAYTQGLMDLGATVCTRSRPVCGQCPMQGICQGHQSGEPQRFPVKTRTLKRRHESWWLLLLRLGGERNRFWLQRRPGSGIWAGLFCPPVYESEDMARMALPPGWLGGLVPLDAVSHSLTHRELRLHPLLLELDDEPQPADMPEGQWVDAEILAQHGLPAPVKLLLQRLLEPDLFAPAKSR
ncbi:A/G-specific adenine glycosylase [Hydrogenophaga sp.]|uniref:A/G-specific adenine glycosylase n=1 Tax=Hydrogenophaga sp. TaxID=1904254 RepID=UPI0025C3BBF4|nr:A/G-specific adenine glycosylase [Hydrogenophaga sp.]MBT9463230.1 A/G-specific adenine glycosylase [Hydrogenophaga sp.]